MYFASYLNAVINYNYKLKMLSPITGLCISLCLFVAAELVSNSI